jgi:hypothetical protein
VAALVPIDLKTEHLDVRRGKRERAAYAATRDLDDPQDEKEEDDDDEEGYRVNAGSRQFLQRRFGFLPKVISPSIAELR